MISNDIIEINRQVVYMLWNVVDPNTPPNGLSPRLIFPELRTGNTRVSEQEARLLWCTALQDTSYYYALEAPTSETYIQSGSTPISARTDLALFLSNESYLERVVDIEFKAHNPEQEKIGKDIEKLIREQRIGNWFHLLSATNSATITKLFKKFIEAFITCNHYVEHDIEIVFCICVLKKPQMYSRHFIYKHSNDDFVTYVRDFFSDTSDWVKVSPETNG